MTQFQVNAIAFREGNAWIVQGIEHDIVVHALDVTAATTAFIRAVAENVVIAEHLGRTFEDIKPAPARFREMFECANLEIKSLKVSDKPHVAVRVAA